MKPVLNAILALLLGLFITFIYYGEVMRSPDSYLFSDKGDGLKNYYSFLYHTKHDTSFVHTSAMNYPFGEVHLFTDGQPANVLFYNVASTVFPKLEQYPVGFLNMTILLSLALGLMFIFLIARKLGLPTWYSLLIGLGLSMLTPQIFRLGGHQSLSYMCFVPMVIWFYWNSIDGRYRWLHSLALGTLVLYFYFVHPYLGFIGTLWVTGDLFVRGLVKNLSWVDAGLRWTIVLVPMLTYFVFTSMVDNHGLRTDDPYGFFRYHAHVKTVFLPHHPPLKPVIESVVPLGRQEWEGWAYIGMGSVIVLLALMVRNFRSKWRFKRRTWLVPLVPQHLKMAVYSSVLLLLFSMTFPFNFGLDFLLDWISPLKQFRSLGRFAWVFYFIAGLFVTYKLYLWIRVARQKKKSPIALSLTGLFFLSLVFEGNVYHNEVGNQITASGNLFKSFEVPVEANKYQAILTLPFGVSGSENFERPGTEKSKQFGYLTAQATGLPLIGGSGARTAIEESKQLVQLVGPTYFEKFVEKSFSKDKSILVCYTGEPLTKYEQKLLDASSSLSNSRYGTWLKLHPSSFFKPQTVPDPIGDVGYRYGLTFFRKRTPGMFHFDNFDTTTTEVSQFGSGARMCIKRRYERLVSFNSRLSTDGEGKPLVATMWVYNKGVSMPQYEIFVEEVLKDKSTLRLASENVMRSEYIWGDWSFLRLEFIPTQWGSEIRIVGKGSDRSDQQTYVDNLMVCPKSWEVWIHTFEKEGSKYGMYNGELYPIK